MKKEYINPRIGTIALPRICLNIASAPADITPAGAKGYSQFMESTLDAEEPLYNGDE